MKFLNNLISGSENAILNAAASLAMVLMMIFLIAWLVKFISRSRITHGKQRHMRLAVNDAISIDAKRRLILVRCDDREHLILIGGSQDLVVESDITPPDFVRFSDIPELAEDDEPDAVPVKTKAKRGKKDDNDEPNLLPGTVAAPLAHAHHDDEPNLAGSIRQHTAPNLGQFGNDPKSVLAAGLLVGNKEAPTDTRSDIERLQDDVSKSSATLKKTPGTRTAVKSAVKPATTPSTTSKAARLSAVVTDTKSDTQKFSDTNEYSIGRKKAPAAEPAKTDTTEETLPGTGWKKPAASNKQ